MVLSVDVVNVFRCYSGSFDMIKKTCKRHGSAICADDIQREFEEHGLDNIEQTKFSLSKIMRVSQEKSRMMQARPMLRSHNLWGI